MTKSLLQRIIVSFKQEDFKYIEDNQIDFIVLEILEGEMPKLLKALSNAQQ
jgi:hypothetical protein